MKKLKQITTFILILTIVTSIIPSKAVADASEGSVVEIGDTIILGTYYDEPILWRCVDIDENGPLMLSEKILCFKSFDAKGNHGNYYRNREGTNNWNDSTLRHWLNSSGTVDWSNRASVPSSENVFSGYNPYDQELGFLSSFTASEMQLVKKVTQKTYINSLDAENADGGTAEYNMVSGDFSSALLDINPATGYFQYSEDCFFLLGPEQLANIYQNSGETYLTAYATSAAIQNDSSGLSTDTAHKYWLRVAGNTGMSYEIVNIVDANQQVSYMSSLSVRNGSTYYSVGVRPAFYLNLDYYQEIMKREDGFNFYLNHPSNYINMNSTVDLHIGYYLNNALDESTDNYIYTISNSDVINVTDSGWSSKYGQKLKVTAKQEGSSIITVTNPNTSESSSLEIFVTGNESGWNFYNIPKMTIEAGKTTNFYNYSGLVVDEFAYTEHKDSLGTTDYYNVTMTVYNSINLYGVVTSHYSDGSIYGYYILDKMDSHDSSFVSSLKSLYYSSGDLYHLIKNDKYYSGKSISTENNVTIDVPVGGYISISNNVAVSDMANLVNFSYLLFDAISVIKDSADWVDSGVQIDKGIKDTVVSNLIAEILANDAIKDEVLSCLKSSVAKEFEGLSLNYDNLIEAFVGVSNKLIKNVGFNIIEELESEICSVMGIASIGESVATKVLPTGWIIEGLYTFSDGCDFAVFFNAYCKSNGRPGGIYIYAPSDSSKYQSNGISIDTPDDMSETVVHAYTVADTGTMGINKNTFVDESTYYSEKYQTYNITLYKNGTETQPSSTVTVRIPIPDRFDKLNRSALKVYRNNDDGTLTDMNAHVEGDYMVFETDHFSYYSIVDESVPLEAEDLKFSGASLTLQDNLTVNYKVDKNQFDANGYTSPYVEFVMNEKKTVVTKYEVIDDKYVFDFSDIAPNLANDTIQATLYAEKEGATYYGEARDYSIAEYCYNMLGKYNTDEYAELRTLLVDLLNYGAASQSYTNYKTDSLVNQSLTEEQLSWGTIETPVLNTVLSKEYIVIDTPTVIWKGAGLNLQDSVNLRFKIEADYIEDISVKVTTDTGIQWIIYSDAFEVTEGGYYVYFDGLNVGQMCEVLYLTVYDDNEIVSNTIRYSVESYAFSKQDSGDESLSALLLAMMKYGNSAHAYAN